MHHYLASGLRNVYLTNGFAAQKTPQGEGVLIEDAEGLHRAITLHLISGKPRLSGAEFRYVREELELTAAQLAALLGGGAKSVALWEKTGRVPKWADLLLRALYREVVEGQAGIVELMERLNKLKKAPARMVFAHSSKGWKAKG
jgi:putative transcriptional regulator